jgi:hypothetical protein
MICPSCNKDQKVTEHNFGALYTCPACKAVYFINFDGQPEYGEVSSEDYEAANNLQKDAAKSVTPPSDNPEPFPDAGLEPLMSVTESADSMMGGTPESGSYLSELLGDAANAGANPFEMNQATPEPVQAPPAPRTQPRPPAVAPKPAATGGNLFADIAQEISDFANTDSNLAGLNYDLTVSGIDTQETKELFKEAIEDSKFAWDAIEIMKSMKHGRIVIQKMSPAKAFLLAKRIQFLDIERTWKQNVLS